MKRTNLFLLVLILLGAQLVFAQEAPVLTVKKIFTSPEFRLKRLNNARWLPDGSGYLFLKEDKERKISSLYRSDIADGAETLWLDGAKLTYPGTDSTFGIEDYHISADAQKVLIKTDGQRVWRRYSKARFFVFDRQSNTIIPVFSQKRRVRHAKLSPDGSGVGFVYANNLYYQDIKNGEITQITNDGSADIINGQFDWVYEEEFGQDDGWRWSPDGKKIAFWRLDQSPEPLFSWTDFEGKRGAVHTIHYPKAGDANALVKIGVYNLENQRTQWMDIGEETDIYIPRIQWTQDANVLSIQRLNRLQNHWDLMLADVYSGKSKVILSESDPCWISITDDVHFLKDKKRFITTSEKDGYRHIYLYDLKGRLIRQLTKGQWEVSLLYGMDEVTNWVYFVANKGDLAQRHIFRIKADGSHLQRISKEVGSHRALFSPSYKYFIQDFSSTTIPLRSTLNRADGSVMRTLINNDIAPFEKYGLVTPEFIRFTTSDGVEIKAMITRPKDFDPHKKYPVLIYGYSGPASQLVRNVWGRSAMWYTLLTQKGYIIFTLDQRGTGGRGKAFKNLAYGNIGKYALQDHIEGVKFLRSLPYVDAKRIGIWGWSGGGYLTLLAMTKGADYFKAGVAVAPVTDFRLYDDIWTERYMGLPQHNIAGYDSTSVLSYARRFKGKLLIVHGASDDNVHMQNTMQFISKLQVQNKQFNLMIYPGRNHSLIGKGSVYLHLYTMMTDFIINNL